VCSSDLDAQRNWRSAAPGHPDHLQEAVTLNPLANKIARRKSVGSRTATQRTERV
jgi:hypothetical protein